MTSIGLLFILIMQMDNQYVTKNNPAHITPINTSSIANQSPDLISFPEITQYAEIIKRPLFYDDRKPRIDTESKKKVKESKTKKKSKKAKSNKKISLTAIVITPETRVAIMQVAKNKKLQRLSLGESINDWTLTNIQNRSATLENGKEIQVLELEIKSSKKSMSHSKTKIETTKKKKKNKKKIQKGKSAME